MKLFLKVVILFIFVTSCSNNDDEIDFYLSQHRSPELMGYWREILKDRGDKPYPMYKLFNNRNYINYNYNELQNKFFGGTTYFWYNDETTIYVVPRNQGFKKEDAWSMFYKLNATKDTLSFYGDKYVKAPEGLPN